MSERLFIYIMANTPEDPFYVGVTNNIVRRVWEHRTDAVEGFTKANGLHRLVYYAEVDGPRAAIEAEKRLKRWRRPWKIQLIAKFNPEWRDLFEDFEKGQW